MTPSPGDGVKVLRGEDLTAQVCVVVGTRPSLVKQSPVIRALERLQVPFFILHSGQHYSYELDQVFVEDLELPAPRYHLDRPADGALHGEQTAAMLRESEQVFLRERPAVVLVGGDANTNLAAALAARKLNLTVCHDEAGLRSRDWLMPEEHNRVMIDHISDYLFTPNEEAATTLRQENVMGEIVVTGSTIVDAVRENAEIARRRSSILADLGLAHRQYLLMTIHHEETVDYRETLAGVIDGASNAASELDMPVLFPMHPRTRKRLEHFGLLVDLERRGTIRPIDPVGYFDFLTLLASANLVMTESGGVIQEACVLHVPCLTLGRATEWLETVEVGANVVCGTDPSAIVSAAKSVLDHPRDWSVPFKEAAAECIATFLGSVVEKVAG